MESTRPAQSTMNRDGSVTCNCGKVCKNKRGLAIHQGKSGCQRVRSSGQRIASLASETQEYSSLDSNHSTEELSVQETAPDVFRNRRRMKTPFLSFYRLRAALTQSRRLVRIDLSKKRAIQRLSQAAERASSWLWLRREEMSWKQSTNAQ